MGAWGVHSFENDSAADLLAALAEAEQPYERAEAVRAAFGAAFTESNHGDLDADTAATAVCGAEVVASALGQPRKDHESDPFELEASFRFYDDSVGMALAVLDQVRADGSELAELWDDSDDADDWRASVADLQARLQKAAKAHGLTSEFDVPTLDTPPDAAERNLDQQISQEIIAKFRDEMEKVADRNKGDPSVEALRQLARAVFRMHTDITNLHYAVTGSVDALAERIKRLEHRLND